MRNHICCLFLCLFCVFAANAQDAGIRWMIGASAGASLNSTHFNHHYTPGVQAGWEVNYRLVNRLSISSGAGIYIKRYNLEGTEYFHNSRDCMSGPLHCIYYSEFVHQRVTSIALPLHLSYNFMQNSKRWMGIRAGATYFINIDGELKEYRYFNESNDYFYWDYTSGNGLSADLLLTGNWLARPDLILATDAGVSAFVAPIHLYNYGTIEEKIQFSPVLLFKVLIPIKQSNSNL